MKIFNSIDATALQQDLDKLAKWEETWQTEFHPQKCSVLHITRCRNPKYKQYTFHGHTLLKEDNAKYLGMMSQKKQISKLARKNKTNSVYFTLVRPQLEYAAATSDPYTQMYKNKMEMVQRRAARYVCNNYSREAVMCHHY